MKTVKIGEVKYPIIQVNSRDEIYPDAEAVQCFHQEDENMRAFFYYEGIRFSANGSSALEASQLISAQVAQHSRDCLEKFPLEGTDIPVRHRNALYDRARGEEGFAPLNVVHWWTKGEDKEKFYKCDIHFEFQGDPISYEAVGPTLAQALNDLAVHLDFWDWQDAIPEWRKTS